MDCPHSSVGKEPTCNAGDPCLIPELGRSPGEGIDYPTPVFLGFPYGSAGKESTHNDGDLGSIPGLGTSPGEGKGCPPQYSGLENSKDCVVHGEAKSRTRLSDFSLSQLPSRVRAAVWAGCLQRRALSSSTSSVLRGSCEHLSLDRLSPCNCCVMLAFGTSHLS